MSRMSCTSERKPGWGPKRAVTGTPRIAIERVNGALRRIVADPAVKERFLRVGAEAVWATPEDMIARAQRERPMWQEAVRVAGARLE